MEFFRALESKFELVVSIILLCSMTIIMAIQVFMRYVMQQSLSWSEELARYIFVWLVFISISYAAKQVTHIRIDASLKLYPEAMRPYVVLFSDILFLGFSIFIFYTAWNVVERQMMLGAESPAIQMPMWILYAAPMVGFLLTAFRQIQVIISRINVMRAS